MVLLLTWRSRSVTTVPLPLMDSILSTHHPPLFLSVLTACLYLITCIFEFPILLKLRLPAPSPNMASTALRMRQVVENPSLPAFPH